MSPFSCPWWAVVAGWVAFAGIPACADHTATSADASLDGGQCSHASAIALPSYETVGSGIINGVDISASVCNVGVALYSSSDSFSPDQFLIRLNWEGTSLFDFQRPAEAAGGTLSGLISVSAPLPGRYTSADSPSPCGVLGFGYRLPVAQEPLVLSLGYQATAPLDCVGDRQTTSGSWTVTLTSVSEFQSDAGQLSTNYLAHGQITASLAGVGPADTAILALAF